MSHYASLTSRIIEQANATEKAFPLKSLACRPQFFFHPHPTEKVCLFFHGFTAGPYQFRPMGDAFFRCGYNVLIPLQPGHGLAGDWNRNNPPPLPTSAQVYQAFAEEWLQIAQQLGEKVIVGGLSTGATLAGWLSLEYPEQLYRVLLFAPYLSSQIKLVNWVVKTLPFYYEWMNKDAQGNFGYDGFSIPAIRLFLEMGQQLLEQAKDKRSAPLFVLSSESDRVTDRDEERALFEGVLQHQPQSWYYCFDKKLDISHRMMTEVEGNYHQDLVIAIAKAFIDSDLTWAEVKEIKNQMRQGKSFADAVDTLNLNQRAAYELYSMMT